MGQYTREVGSSWVAGPRFRQEHADTGSVNSGELVSTETLQQHYGWWRWRIERESSNRLVMVWQEIAASALPEDTKVRLADVAWALGAFERAFDVLMADIERAERARREGVPPVLAMLTGPYPQSLDYLVAMGLWMDLGDVLAAYRTIPMRLKHLTARPLLRAQSTKWTKADIDQQVDLFRARTIPALGAEPVMEMANTILHHTWEPSAQRDLSVQLHWKGAGHQIVDFAQDDVREALTKLVEETLEQVYLFVRAQL